MMIAQPKQNVPFADYLKWPYVSQSSLKEGRTSMLHMKWAMETEKVATDAMNLGSALHCGFLEPELLPERVVLWDGKTRAKGAKNSDDVKYTDFQELHAGKIILTNGYYENLKGMLRRMRTHPRIIEWNARPGQVEVSHVAEINGVMVRGRCDKLTDDPILDAKATSVNLKKQHKVTSHVIEQGWHLQGAIYCRLFNRKRFILALVNTTGPWDTVTFEVTPDLLAIGDHEAMILLEAWKVCCKNNYWPGISEELEQLEVPSWMKQQQELTTGGVPVNLTT